MVEFLLIIIVVELGFIVNNTWDIHHALKRLEEEEL